jgi:hypothetical protein
MDGSAVDYVNVIPNRAANPTEPPLFPFNSNAFNIDTRWHSISILYDIRYLFYGDLILILYNEKSYGCRDIRKIYLC